MRHVRSPERSMLRTRFVTALGHLCPIAGVLIACRKGPYRACEGLREGTWGNQRGNESMR
jgi:hypothetical protein